MDDKTFEIKMLQEFPEMVNLSVRKFYYALEGYKARHRNRPHEEIDLKKDEQISELKATIKILGELNVTLSEALRTANQIIAETNNNLNRQNSTW